MRILGKFFTGSPMTARVAPFLIFLALTFCQGQFGAASAYWFYFAKTFVGLWLIFEMWPFVAEMRPAFSWEAVVVGIGVFAIWVGLDPFYPHLMKHHVAWNPLTQFGKNSDQAWLIIVTRILGSALIVPPLEEVFYRSFIYRYIAQHNFLSVPLNQFLPRSFFGMAIIFGFSHNEWLAGILCGMAYQWLVIRKNRLGDAMTAHAITNFLLGVWVVWQGAWNFW